MALAIEIEFLGRVSYGAVGPDAAESDWPPQPDRVFSALVATWAAHGQPDDERRALEWLERMPAPALCAGRGAGRDAPVVFVPPNDASVQRAKLAARVWPVLRNRQPRRFPALWLNDAVVRHYWSEDPDEVTLEALDRLARDTSYIGHSSSLTRCRFSRSAPQTDLKLQFARRRIYPGRLQELCTAYERFRHTADKKDRPVKGALAQVVPTKPAAPPNVFSHRWLVLEHGQGEMPDLRAAALIARGIRIALMSGYRQLGLPVPPEVSGHEADGAPTRQPHLAVVPLSFTGHEHADGRVLGFALVPPSAASLFEEPHFTAVLRRLAPIDAASGRRWLEVKSPEGTAAGQAFALRLSPVFEPMPGMRSLEPGLYTGASRDWATVTPIALDRRPKQRGDERQAEMAELTAAACLRIGLPRPVAVRIDKHSAIVGAPSAYPSGNAPQWAGWRLPDSLAGRVLTHAAIRFESAVSGPLLLGAGRFVGLGLCRPLSGEPA